MAIEQIRAEIAQCEINANILKADVSVKSAEVLKSVDVCAAYEMVSKIVNNVQRIFVTVLYAIACAITVGLVPLADLVIKMIRSGKKEKAREALQKSIKVLVDKIKAIGVTIISLKTKEQAENVRLKIADEDRLKQEADEIAAIAAKEAEEITKREHADLLAKQEDVTFTEHIVPMINDSIKHIGADAKACISREQLDEMNRSVREKIDVAQEETLKAYTHFSDRIKDQIRAKYKVYRQRYAFVLGCRVNMVESIRVYVEDLERRIDSFERPLSSKDDIEQVQEDFITAVNSSRDVQIVYLKKLGFDSSDEEKRLAVLFKSEVDSILQVQFKKILMPKIQEAVQVLFMRFEGLSEDGNAHPDGVVSEEDKFGSMTQLQQSLKQRFVASGFGTYGDKIVDEIFTALARSLRRGSFDTGGNVGIVDVEDDVHTFEDADADVDGVEEDADTRGQRAVDTSAPLVGRSPEPSPKVSGSGSEGGDDTQTSEDEDELSEEKVN